MADIYISSKYPWKEDIMLWLQSLKNPTDSLVSCDSPLTAISPEHPICPIPSILEGFPLPLLPSLFLHTGRHLYLERIMRQPQARCFARPTPALNTSQRGATSPHARPRSSCKAQSHQLFFSSELRGAAVSRLKGACGLNYLHITASETTWLWLFDATPNKDL